MSPLASCFASYEAPGGEAMRPAGFIRGWSKPASAAGGSYAWGEPDPVVTNGTHAGDDPRRKSGAVLYGWQQAIGDTSSTGRRLLKRRAKRMPLDFNRAPANGQIFGALWRLEASAASSTAAGWLLASRKQRRGDDNLGSKKGSYMR